MSPQENQLLSLFLQQLTEVKNIAKDPEVAAMIEKASAQQPDAVYLLVQRALMQDQALQAAAQKISQLQEELSKTTSTPPANFFANSGAWGNSSASAASASLSAAPNAMRATAPPAAFARPPAQLAPAAGSSFFGGNTGSMLGTVAATAAGVAAGAFLFQGLGHMMGGNHQSSAAASAAPAGNDQGLVANSFADDSSAAAADSNIDSASADDTEDSSDDSEFL